MAEGSFNSPGIAVLIGEDDQIAEAVAHELVGQEAGLVPADLKEQRTPGSQISRTVADDASQDAGAVGAAIVGKRRLERERVPLEERQLRRRHVGNDADNHVDGAGELTREGREEIAAVYLDTVRGGASNRACIDIGCHHPCTRAMLAEHPCDRTGPRAEIDGRPLLRQPVNGSTRERLAEPARHIDVRIHADVDPAERNHAGDPGKWLAGEAAPNRRLEEHCVAGRVRKQFPRLLLRRDESLSGKQRGQRLRIDQGSLKCGFSMMPRTPPPASRSAAIRMPSPTACTAACSAAPLASSVAYASSAFATPQYAIGPSATSPSGSSPSS